MKGNKGLFVIGFLLAIVVLIANVGIPAMAGEAYDFDCRDVVKYSPGYYNQPMKIVPNNLGGATMTMPVELIEFTTIELGSVSGKTHEEKTNNVRWAIYSGAPVDFYNSADGSYRPFTLYRKGLRIALNEFTTPEPGVGVGGRIKTAIDDHDGYIYFHFPGTLVTKGTIQVNGEEVALTPFGYTPRYW